MAKKKKGTLTGRVTAFLTDYVGKKKKIPNTAAAVANLAGDMLKTRVSPNMVCRILTKLGVKFKASANDPAVRHYSKVDLLRSYVDTLATRLTKVETKLRAK